LRKYKRAIIGGILSDSIIYILTIIISLIVVPIYLHFVSLKEYGAYIAINSIVAIISLADIGMSMYTEKKLSNDDFFYSKRTLLYLYSMQIFQYLLGIILLILGILVALKIDLILSIDEKYLQSVRELFFFSWLGVVIGVIFGLNHAIIKSRHKLKYMNIIMFIKFLLINVFSIILLYFNYGLISFGIAIFISTLIINLIVFLKVKREYNINICFPTKINFSYIKEGWNYVKQFQILKIAHIAKTSLFTVLLNNYGGQIIVAKYNITNKIPQLIPGFISKLVTNLFPSLASYFEKGEKKKIREFYEKIFKIGIFVTLFSVYGLCSLNELFVSIWVGSDKFIGYDLFVFILLNFIILIFISFTGIIIQASGEFEKMPFVSLIETVIFIFLSYVLFKLFGLYGFFIGYIIASFIGLIYSIYLVNKILNVNLFKWIKEGIKSFVLIFIFMAVSDFFVKKFIDNDLNKFVILFLLYIIYFIVFSKIYTKIDLLKFIVGFIRSNVEYFLLKLNRGGEIIVVSRTACLGDRIIKILFENKRIINFNFPKNRVDLIVQKQRKNIPIIKMYKFFRRLDVLQHCIFMQNKNFFDKRLQPQYIFFDSFSELTDQKFTHKKDKFSFYCHWSDLKHNEQFKKEFECEGLLELEKLEKYYVQLFDKVNKVYGKVPIIFIHFSTYLDKRDRFKYRAQKIKQVIEKLTNKYDNLYSISIEDKYVTLPVNQDKFPYHYSDETYNKYVEKIRKLGVINE